MMLLDDVRLIAHRGNSLHLPENSMAAFNSAMEVGAHMIELDVRLSQDGQPVVIHDDTVDRTTRGRGAVADLPLAALKRLGVPALEDVLLLPIPLNIEVKAPAAAPVVAEMVKDLSGIVISSFDQAVLASVRTVNPDQPVAYLARAEDRREVLQAAIDARAYAFNPPRTTLSPRMVEEAHAAGVRVMVYTINNPDEAQRAFIWGADAVFTDDPASMLAIL